MKNDGSNERVVVALPDGATAESPSVSPDGAKVAYGDERVDADGTAHQRLMVVPRQGGTPVMLAAGTEPRGSPTGGVRSSSGDAERAEPQPNPQSAPNPQNPQNAPNPPAPATATATADDAQAIRAAIDRANAAWTSATQSLDAAALDGAVAGDELQSDQDDLDQLRAQGRTQKNVNTAFTVVDVNQDRPGHAIVHTRETWYAENYDAASGDLIERTPAATYNETYVVEQVNGGWIVTRNDLQ